MSDPSSPHRPQQGQGPIQIVVVIQQGVGHRFTHGFLACQMNDRVNFMGPQRPLDCGKVPDIARNQTD